MLSCVVHLSDVYVWRVYVTDDTCAFKHLCRVLVVCTGESVLRVAWMWHVKCSDDCPSCMMDVQVV